MLLKLCHSEERKRVPVLLRGPNNRAVAIAGAEGTSSDEETAPLRHRGSIGMKQLCVAFVPFVVSFIGRR